MVFQLRKCLCGVRQSSHSWYSTDKDFMKTIRFIASYVDRGLFVLHGKEDHGILVAAVILYIDDHHIIANPHCIGQIEDQMKIRCRVHDLGSVSCYLGMNIEHYQELRIIDIPQHSYILTILAKVSIDQTRSVGTQMVIKFHQRNPEEAASNLTTNQLMIGSHTYMRTATWPDIAYAIGVLSQYNHDASNEHMVALLWVFRTLNGTKDWWLHSGGALRDTQRSTQRSIQRSTQRRTRWGSWMLCQLRLCWMPGWL